MSGGGQTKAAKLATVTTQYTACPTSKTTSGNTSSYPSPPVVIRGKSNSDCSRFTNSDLGEFCHQNVQIFKTLQQQVMNRFTRRQSTLAAEVLARELKEVELVPKNFPLQLAAMTLQNASVFLKRKKMTTMNQ